MTEKLFTSWNSAVPCHRATTLADAIDQAQAHAAPGETVLFSPGCSSFDMFCDFEDRGDQFRALVQAKQK
jgi:UDP-N-acetylmuramoylalanine--D-glutamate ligase